MNSLLFSLNATIPVFGVMIMGNLLKRVGMLNKPFADAADRFLFNICLPCLVFLDLADTNIRENFDFYYLGFCFISTLISILIIWLLSKKLIKEKTAVGSFVQGAYRSSAAILGIAFIQNIYGDSGMAPLMIIGSVPLYNIFAVIVLTFEGSKPSATGNKNQMKSACLNILKNPIIIGIFLGLLASYINLELPKIAYKTVSNLAVMAAPLALISIGISFEGRKALSKIKLTFAASFIKLIGLAVLFLPVAVACGFRDQKLMAILIMLASPCTPSAYIMAKNMDGDEVLASSIVVTTTILSSVTLTFWIFLMHTLKLIQ